MQYSSWVRYIDRSYNDIRSSLIRNLKIRVPEMSDYTPSNLLIILVDMFASVGEVINYYIDTTARELFVSSARRMDSLLKLADLAGYSSMGQVAARADVKVTLLQSGLPVHPTSDVPIPVGTIFRDSLGRNWRMVNPTIISPDYNHVMVPVRQWDPITDYLLGEANGSPSQEFALPPEVSTGSLSIKVQDDIWDYVDSLGFSSPDSKHFTTGMGENGSIYVRFGDGVKGAIPPSGSNIRASYMATQGLSGNMPVGSISQAPSLVAPAGYTFEISQPFNAYGGKGFDTLEDIRGAIPRVSRSLYRAVSKTDYADLTGLYPGIRSAVVDFSCTVGVTVYAVPWGGGNTSEGFLNEIRDYLQNVSVLGIPVFVKSSGESKVMGRLTVKPHLRIPKSVTRIAVEKVLTDVYSPYITGINQSVYSSDIIAMVRNLPEVEWVKLEYFYIQPYLRPSKSDLLLDYTIEVLPAASSLLRLKLTYDGTQFQVIGGSGIMGNVPLSTPTTISDMFTITINAIPSGAVANDQWTFTVHPFNKDATLSDFSIPVSSSNFFIIDIV